MVNGAELFRLCLEFSREILYLYVFVAGALSWSTNHGLPKGTYPKDLQIGFAQIFKIHSSGPADRLYILVLFPESGLGRGVDEPEGGQPLVSRGGNYYYFDRIFAASHPLAGVA